MRKKIILLDMDGLVVKKTEVFSIRISKKLGIPLNDVLVFIKKEFQDCLVGKADLKVELTKYASSWGWKDSIGELTKFWFEGEKALNDEVLSKVDILRKQGHKVYLATNNEKYRVAFLWDKIGIKKHFDGLFSSASLGLKKPNPEFYLKILKLLKTNPNNVIFIDDDEENVASAKEIGIDARFFSSINDLEVV